MAPRVFQGVEKGAHGGGVRVRVFQVKLLLGHRNVPRARGMASQSARAVFGEFRICFARI